jgi:hypothetical protein
MKAMAQKRCVDNLKLYFVICADNISQNWGRDIETYMSVRLVPRSTFAAYHVAELEAQPSEYCSDLCSS